MAAQKSLKSPAINVPAGSAWAEELAEYTYQLLRRLAPEGIVGLQVTPPAVVGGPAYDHSASLETAPEWVREAHARATKSSAAGLSDAGARAFVARDRLTQALHRRNMSQAELARQLGKSPTSISRIFKTPHRSRVTTLQAIAAVLQVDLADILGS
jgi:DNA-binding Xre family transcriptional regulator